MPRKAKKVRHYAKGATQASLNRENLLRRVAARQGLRISKVRRVDPKALDYGHYHLWAGEQRVNLEAPTLDAIEAFLFSRPPGSAPSDPQVIERFLSRRAWK